VRKSSDRRGGQPRPGDKRPGEVFAARLAEVRDRRGWTQVELSKRLRQLGYSLPAEQISRIETGKRGVKLDDAFALAYALDCSLVHLLVEPDANEPEIVVVGNVQPERQQDVRDWISGAGPLLDQDPVEYARQRPRRDIEAEIEAVRAIKIGDPTTPLAAFLRQALERSGELPPLLTHQDDTEGTD
jgi:transcriptional regulator with XRE-family HTH domain